MSSGPGPPPLPIFEAQLALRPCHSPARNKMSSFSGIRLAPLGSGPSHKVTKVDRKRKKKKNSSARDPRVSAPTLPRQARRGFLDRTADARGPPPAMASARLRASSSAAASRELVAGLLVLAWQILWSRSWCPKKRGSRPKIGPRCGCQNRFGIPFWLVGAPPILAYFSGNWDVHLGYRILTPMATWSWTHYEHRPLQQKNNTICFLGFNLRLQKTPRVRPSLSSVPSQSPQNHKYPFWKIDGPVKWNKTYLNQWNASISNQANLKRTPMPKRV